MTNTIIDVRSDTLTKPTQSMRLAMSEALVGDDVYGEDPTVNRLQDSIAELFGKESALFVPTGVMGNQLAIAVHTQRGDEIIVESESHIFHYETAAPAIIAGVQMYCIPSRKGEMPLDSIKEAIRPPVYYFPKTSLICIEQTHNRHGGTIVSLDYMQSLHALGQEFNLPIHCDGARIWNACAAANVEPHVFAQYADTLSVCLSKGLGAPIGSVLIGSKEHIEQARHWRKVLGGGMRQAGILAAAGLHAIEHHRSMLQEDHEKAALFASLITQDSQCIIANSSGNVESNIVIIGCGENVNPSDVQAMCEKKSLFLSMGRGRCLRAVFHRDISMDMIQTAAEIFCSSYRILENART